MNKPRSLRVFLSFALLLLMAHSARAQTTTSTSPAPSVVTRSAEVEVIERASGGSKTNTAIMSISLVGDGVPSTVNAHIAGADYRIHVHQRARSAGSVTTLSIKSLQRKGGHAIFEVEARAVTPLGKRVVLSEVQAPDGSRFELAITLH